MLRSNALFRSPFAQVLMESILSVLLSLKSYTIMFRTMCKVYIHIAEYL